MRLSLRDIFLGRLLPLLLAALLFMLANPNALSADGLGFLAWVYYVPVFFLVRNIPLRWSWLYGGVYGVLAYGLYVSWLLVYDALTFCAVCLLYFLLCALLFVLLKASELLFGRGAVLAQALVLAVYEHCKTWGFLGFSYGVTGYTQWRYPLVVQVADFIGAQGLSVLMIFCSASVFQVLTRRDKGSVVCAGCCAVLLGLMLLYGANRLAVPEHPQKMTVAAIQNNENPWENGIESSRKNISSLILLTDTALKENPGVKLVVWPETAVLPAILYNYRLRGDSARYEIVTALLDYIDSKDAAFVIGNFNRELTAAGEKLDFNSALFFVPGKNVIPPEPALYSKMHLVPLTEYFPYKAAFPRLYQKLLGGGAHLWQPGTEISVFSLEDLRFSTPICFEDTFPDICRAMVKKGSRCFVNLSDDAWSKSLVCQQQHLAMALFRSVENRVPSVRSTSSGQTCIITPKGRVAVLAEPFCETFAAGDIEVLPEDFKITFYTRFGTWTERAFVLAAAGIFAVKLILAVINAILCAHRKK